MPQDLKRQSEELDIPKTEDAELHQSILDKGRQSHGEAPQYSQVQDPAPVAPDAAKKPG